MPMEPVNRDNTQGGSGVFSYLVWYILLLVFFPFQVLLYSNVNSICSYGYRPLNKSPKRGLHGQYHGPHIQPNEMIDVSSIEGNEKIVGFFKHEHDEFRRVRV